ncbi:MAG: type II secretion system protein GspC, partial [Polyangiales bacterium]
MDSLLKRHFWVVVLFFGGLATWFFATGLTQLIAGKWLPLEPAALGGPRPVLSLAPLGSVGGPKRNLEAKTILEANPFDSVTGPIYESPVASIAPAPVDDANGERMFSACSGGPKLSIVVMDPLYPSKSFAVVSTGEGSANKPLVREGSSVNGREVAVIVREKVYFKEGNSYCYVGMFLPPEAAKPPPPAPGPVMIEAPGGPGKVPPDIEKGIQKIDDTNFNIDRTVVDKIIENQAELMKSARIVPEQENGKVVGIRLLNIRPDTLLGKLGLQTGDQLRTINGFDMSSPEKALEAYAKLRTAPQIQVGVVRNG